MVVFGGSFIDGARSNVSKLEVTAEGATWIENVPTYGVMDARTHHQAALWGDRMYVFGGGTKKNGTAHGGLAYLEMRTMMWVHVGGDASNAIPMASRMHFALLPWPTLIGPQSVVATRGRATFDELRFFRSGGHQRLRFEASQDGDGVGGNFDAPIVGRTSTFNVVGSTTLAAVVQQPDWELLRGKWQTAYGSASISAAEGELHTLSGVDKDASGSLRRIRGRDCVGWKLGSSVGAAIVSRVSSDARDSREVHLFHNHTIPLSATQSPMPLYRCATGGVPLPKQPQVQLLDASGSPAVFDSTTAVTAELVFTADCRGQMWGTNYRQTITFWQALREEGGSEEKTTPVLTSLGNATNTTNATRASNATNATALTTNATNVLLGNATNGTNVIGTSVNATGFFLDSTNTTNTSAESTTTFAGKTITGVPISSESGAFTLRLGEHVAEAILPTDSDGTIARKIAAMRDDWSVRVHVQEIVVENTNLTRMGRQIVIDVGSMDGIDVIGGISSANETAVLPCLNCAVPRFESLGGRATMIECQAQGGSFAIAMGHEVSLPIGYSDTEAVVKTKLLAMSSVQDVHVVFAAGTLCRQSPVRHGMHPDAGKTVVTWLHTAWMDNPPMAHIVPGTLTSNTSAIVASAEAMPMGKSSLLVHISGSTTVRAVNGIADFSKSPIDDGSPWRRGSGLSVTAACGVHVAANDSIAEKDSVAPLTALHRLQFVSSSETFPTVVSEAFRVATGAPANIRVRQEPLDVQVGLLFKESPSAEVRDAGGNVVSWLPTGVAAIHVEVAVSATGASPEEEDATTRAVALQDAAGGLATFTSLSFATPSDAVALRFEMREPVSERNTGPQPLLYAGAFASGLSSTRVLSDTFSVAASSARRLAVVHPLNLPMLDAMLNGANFSLAIEGLASGGARSERSNETVAVKLGGNPLSRAFGSRLRCVVDGEWRYASAVDADVKALEERTPSWHSECTATLEGGVAVFALGFVMLPRSDADATEPFVYEVQRVILHRADASAAWNGTFALEFDAARLSDGRGGRILAGVGRAFVTHAIDANEKATASLETHLMTLPSMENFPLEVSVASTVDGLSKGWLVRWVKPGAMPMLRVAWSRLEGGGFVTTERVVAGRGLALQFASKHAATEVELYQ